MQVYTVSHWGVVQMNSCDDVRKNLQKTEMMLSNAKKAGVEIVVLPEVFAFVGKDDRSQFNIREKLGEGEIQDFLSTQAKRHQMWIVAGTLPTLCHDAKRVFSTMLVLDPDGQQVCHYNKIHLFDVTVEDIGRTYSESAIYAPGDEVVTLDTPFGVLGLSTCYDLRFPELYRKQVSRGATILVIVAAFTLHTGEAHWETLLRARAIENQAWVVASNQCGMLPNGVATYGHSAIIDPWGRVVQMCTQNEGPIMQTVNIDKVTRLRSLFPCLEHRRVKP